MPYVPLASLAGCRSDRKSLVRARDLEQQFSVLGDHLSDRYDSRVFRREGVVEEAFLICSIFTVLPAAGAMLAGPLLRLTFTFSTPGIFLMATLTAWARWYSSVINYFRFPLSSGKPARLMSTTSATNRLTASGSRSTWTIASTARLRIASRRNGRLSR